jgi:hypothetical protein
MDENWDRSMKIVNASYNPRQETGDMSYLNQVSISNSLKSLLNALQKNTNQCESSFGNESV